MEPVALVILSPSLRSRASSAKDPRPVRAARSHGPGLVPGSDPKTTSRARAKPSRKREHSSGRARVRYRPSLSQSPTVANCAATRCCRSFGNRAFRVSFLEE
jgi:hypothetical protein